MFLVLIKELKSGFYLLKKGPPSNHTKKVKIKIIIKQKIPRTTQNREYEKENEDEEGRRLGI